jgi:hypothetical protein
MNVAYDIFHHGSLLRVCYQDTARMQLVETEPSAIPTAI